MCVCVTQVAKDLGVHHCGYNDKRRELDAKLKGLQTTSPRIKIARGAQMLRGTMMASMLYSGCLYGSEWHYITNRQTQQMRSIMCATMRDEQRRRPDGTRLLAEHKGKWEPEIVRI